MTENDRYEPKEGLPPVVNPWAAEVAEQVRSVLAQTPQQWLSPLDFGAVYRYSPDQAGHILRRACEYGALERTKAGRRFVYRPAADNAAAQA